METICMKSQILFAVKNKKYITNLSSAELAKSVVKAEGRCVTLLMMDLPSV